MKKKICFFAAVILAVLTLTSCLPPIAVYNEEDSEDISFERTVLYSKEAPAEELVWRVTLYSPRPDTGRDKESGYYRFDTEISAESVEKLPQDKSDYTKEFLRMIKMTERGFERKYDVRLGEIEEDERLVYADRTVFILTLETGEEIVEGSSTGYRKRVIIAEKHDGEVYVDFYDEPYTQEEYAKACERYGVGGFPYRRMRQGNIIYLRYRYYDLETHTIKTYGAENWDSGVSASGFKAFDRLKETEFSGYFDKESNEHGADIPNDLIAEKIVGGRQYSLLSTGRRYYKYAEDGARSFAGNELYYAVFDTDTGDLLYLERIILKNYYAEPSANSGLYVKHGGKFTEAYIK